MPTLAPVSNWAVARFSSGSLALAKAAGSGDSSKQKWKSSRKVDEEDDGREAERDGKSPSHSFRSIHTSS